MEKKVAIELTTKEIQVLGRAMVIVKEIRIPCCEACANAEDAVLNKLNNAAAEAIGNALN